MCLCFVENCFARAIAMVLASRARGGNTRLFRTQRYGRDMVSSVYRSKDPLDFGVEDDRFFVCTLPVAAPGFRRQALMARPPDLPGQPSLGLPFGKKGNPKPADSVYNR